MVIDYKDVGWKAVPNFKGGEGTVFTKMADDGLNKYLIMKMPPDTTTGYHIHEGSSEIIYILEGDGKTNENGNIVPVHAGMSCYCPEGESHQMINDSAADLIFFAVVPTQHREG